MCILRALLRFITCMALRLHEHAIGVIILILDVVFCFAFVPSSRRRRSGRSTCFSRTQEGYTALMSAAFYGQIDCARLLVEGGADMDAKDNVRYTCMHRVFIRHISF